MKINKFLENPDTVLSTALKIAGATIGIGAAIDVLNDENDIIETKKQLRKAENDQKKQLKQAQKYRKNAIFNESQINKFANDSLIAKLFQNRSINSNVNSRLNVPTNVIEGYDNIENDSLAMTQFSRTPNDVQRIKVNKFTNNTSFNNVQEDMFENVPMPIDMFQNRNNHTNAWGGIRY